MSDNKRRKFLVKGLAVGVTVLAVETGFPFCMRAVLAATEPQADAPEGRKQKALKDLAYCGFDCEKECAIYKATKENDMQIKTQVAERWETSFGVKIKPEDVACDGGCRATEGRLGYHCEYVCDVRKCGLERGVESCVLCEDFPTCDKELWKGWPEMHQRTVDRRKQMS